MNAPHNDFDMPGQRCDLAQFDDDFAQASASSSEELPNGKYQVRIDSVRLAATQKGDPMLKWDLLVLSGTHAGRHLFKNSVISPASLPYVKGDLQMLGLALSKLSELTSHLDDLLDKTLEVTKRTRGDYTNVYFNRLITLASDELGSEHVPF